MNREERAALAGHMAAAGAARLLQWAATAAAAGALFWKGPAAALAIGFFAGLFYLARPGPDSDLDKKTGRQ